jgi:hypothetical protein
VSQWEKEPGSPCWEELDWEGHGSGHLREELAHLRASEDRINIGWGLALSPPGTFFFSRHTGKADHLKGSVTR